MNFRALAVVSVLCGCGGGGVAADGGADVATSDVETTEAASDAADAAADSAGDAGALSLGTVGSVTPGACPQGAPANATCETVTVSGCAGIETESITATLAIVAPSGTPKGTVAHFSGGGGEGFEETGSAAYAAAGFRQVYVAWKSDWEQTKASGVKTAGCRPATVMHWIFTDASLHAGSRALPYCGQGFSGGAGQLGYALSDYGLADDFDYVNELSGPPFARIDLGCDGDAPSTAMVCGATDTMQLPSGLDSWENIAAPLHCGSTGVPSTEVDRWKNDSIATGGLYAYPKTEVQFYDCTYQSTAVTAMAQIYYGLVLSGASNDAKLASYHCYTQADGCQGEGLGKGAQDATNALVSECIARHQ